MKIIYDGGKHKSLWGLGFGVVFGLAFAALASRPLFGKEVGTSGMTVAVLFAGLGLWMSWSTLRTYLTLPIDVSILDGGAIKVRSRSGEPIVMAASDVKRIRYRYEGPKGTLKVTAGMHDWSLPASVGEADAFIGALPSVGEADAFIGALLALNPQIQVERKEFTTAA